MTLTDTSVVVGVDGSPDSHAAVELGAWEANRRDLPLRLVHGVVPPVAYGPTFSAARLSGTELAQARALLDNTATALNDRYPRLTVTQAAVVRGPAGLLVDESATASLVLVGSRGHRVLTRLLGGSVSGQVAAHAHAPVLIVREHDPVPGTGPVVVGIDGSAPAEAALAFAAEEADARRVPLIAVHALRPCVVDGVNAAVGLREAADGAGLLVVGCRGHGGFAALLLGSVSQSLAGNASAPLAVVHEH
jgi:nucleotide-binding universal stress UspA family protein